MEALCVDGKFFRAGGSRIAVRAVTYGPFPGGWPEDFSTDFQGIAAAGFNALRLYEMPTRNLLDAALAHGLRVMGGLKWPQAVDFLKDERILASAKVSLAEALRPLEDHPALAAVFVANEVPADLVRWMGPVKVRKALESVITLGKELRPGLLWCYGNYPSTEYLEPENADFTAFNVYLEDEGAFRKYLRRLHHIAGDRPVMISEFGLDSRRNGLERQAETLAWGIRAMREEGTAGLTIYAWSDRWWNAGLEVKDWDFGLVDRDGRPKPALPAVAKAFAVKPPITPDAKISVIVCTRNGRPRIGACLKALEKQSLSAHEVIVVDDGSSDGTAGLVEKQFPGAILIRLEPSGLSAARNAGAEAATGEFVAFTDDDCEPDRDWLAGLATAFAKGWDGVGGPNLPPPPKDAVEAVVAAAPGAPSHVMLDDEEAEHLPGCNIAVRRTAYFDIGGFDPQFKTAGDDVDFCWRLRDKGYRLGFAPTAFVWHHRRPALRGYLRQQIGYGKAEALLIAKHPRRFTSNGDAKWEGFVYSGGPVRAVEGSIIYYGQMGLAGYQGVVDRMQPLRPLDTRFDNLLSRTQLDLVSNLQPRIRAWFRCRGWWRPAKSHDDSSGLGPGIEFSLWSANGASREDFLEDLLAQGWQPGESSGTWDVEKSGTRILLAAERGDGGGRSVLARVWGTVPSALGQFRKRN
ncbi:glycosyltransferase [Luteolibacter sp. GHJ8]|uniref:Glycosyltransferase n=1 Tax=Luteolibacter rhizosphaerae TaxID=2989719 RepID=A0ABT3G0N2_9BACT|nr:glycosyltransferase [Luteolibacter rhizosphaerae]MCW1913383.1 glycosyltransferase [Luteolibacter rhizosphaerae]